MPSNFFNRPPQRRKNAKSSSNENSFDELFYSLRCFSLTKTALWNVSPEDKVKISATRLSALCERVIGSTCSDDSYRFPPSVLQRQSDNEFGRVEWWQITTTDPLDDEVRPSPSPFLDRSMCRSLSDSNDPVSSHFER